MDRIAEISPVKRVSLAVGLGLGAMGMGACGSSPELIVAPTTSEAQPVNSVDVATTRSALETSQVPGTGLETEPITAAEGSSTTSTVFGMEISTETLPQTTSSAPSTTEGSLGRQTTPEIAGSEYVITTGGYGPLTIGSTMSEVANLGVRFNPACGGKDRNALDNIPGLPTVTFSNNRVANITFDDEVYGAENVKTRSGIGFGATVDDIQRAYAGKFEVIVSGVPAEYGDQTRRIVRLDTNEPNEIIFSISGAQSSKPGTVDGIDIAATGSQPFVC